MLTIQEHLDQNESKSRKSMFLDGRKIGDLEGKELIIEDYKELQYLYISNLSNLVKITIKDCEKLNNLEFYLDKQLEIILVGNVSLKSIKTSSAGQKPVIVYQKTNEKDFCWGCILHSVSLIGMIILIVVVVYLMSIIKELKRKLKLK